VTNTSSGLRQEAGEGWLIQALTVRATSSESDAAYFDSFSIAISTYCPATRIPTDRIRISTTVPQLKTDTDSASR